MWHTPSPCTTLHQRPAKIHWEFGKNLRLPQLFAQQRLATTSAALRRAKTHFFRPNSARLKKFRNSSSPAGVRVYVFTN
jgi:hypothetical protein